MSTNGSVAWQVPGGRLKGVYNHSDSYPTDLGARVFTEARRRGLAALAALLPFYGDWRQVLTNSVCEYCGKVTGQPHSLGLVMGGFGEMGRAAFVAMRRQQSAGRPDMWAMYEKEIAGLDVIAANMARTGYPDPDAKGHQHGAGAADQFDPFSDPLSMEWVYVLRPEMNLIEVWVGVRYVATAARHWERWSKRKVKYEGGFACTHVHVADVRMDTDPDWDAIELRGGEMRDGNTAAQQAA